MHLWHFHAGPAERLRQRFARLALAVNKDRAVRRLYAPAPIRQFGPARMRREAVDGVDMRAHGNLLAEKLHRLRAVDDDSRQRALRREADEDDAAIPVAPVVPEPAMITAPERMRFSATDSDVSRVK